MDSESVRGGQLAAHFYWNECRMAKDNEDTNRTVTDLWDIFLDEKKLASFEGFKLAAELGIPNSETFHDILPWEECAVYVSEEMTKVMSKIPDESKEGLVWEHVGSTAIPGMPGTLFPDALLNYPSFPPPRDAFSALIHSGFTFIGSGKIHPRDVWFKKKISRPGSILDGQSFKVHFCPTDNGVTRLLLETRDRCRENREDFEDYRDAKIEASKLIAEGPGHNYKGAKGKSKLLTELTTKHNCFPTASQPRE